MVPTMWSLCSSDIVSSRPLWFLFSLTRHSLPYLETWASLLEPVSKKGQVRKYCVVQSSSHVWLFVTLWTAVHQASLSFTISLSLLKFMSNESVMLSNFILCHPLLLWPSIFSSIRIFSNESVLHNRWLLECIGASASAWVCPMRKD